LLLLDQGILERHDQLESTIGSLDMELESLGRARIFSWVFFPTWIFLAIIQAICFLLGNEKFHPLAEILEGFVDDDNNKGMLWYLWKNNIAQKTCLIEFQIIVTMTYWTHIMNLQIRSSINVTMYL
jgi:hypothetical protein